MPRFTVVFGAAFYSEIEADDEDTARDQAQEAAQLASEQFDNTTKQFDNTTIQTDGWITIDPFDVVSVTQEDE